MTGDGSKYECQTRSAKGETFCQGITTRADRIDTAVGEAWVMRVAGLEPGSAELDEVARRWQRFTHPETEAMALQVAQALASAQERLRALEDRYWSPKPGVHPMSEAEYERQGGRLSATVAQLEAKMREQSAEAAGPISVEPAELTESWAGASVELRRVLLRAVWPDGVTLLPPTGRGDRTPINERLRWSGAW
jgi:hypothetical protein